MKLQYTHIIPPTSGITDAATKKWADKIVHFLDETFRKVASIPFNRSSTLEIADTGVADSVNEIPHYLMRTPEGFFVSYTNKAVIVYDAGDWTTTVIRVKFNAANAHIKLVVF